MNTNRIKKIAVRFPNFVSRNSIEYEGKRLVLKLPEIQNVNNMIYSKLFADPSSVSIGAQKLPKIEGFNCTWRNDVKDPAHIIAQFSFASGEEKKVSKIIEKYQGVVVESRADLNQWEIQETNGSGKVCEFENVNEIITHKQL